MPVKVSLSDVTAVESLALSLDDERVDRGIISLLSLAVMKSVNGSTLRSGLEFSEHERTCLSKVLAKEAVKVKPACDAYVDAITRWLAMRYQPLHTHRYTPDTTTGILAACAGTATRSSHYVHNEW